MANRSPSDIRLVTTSPFWAMVRLIRPWNVIIIGVTMWIIRWSLILPDREPVFDSLSFGISTVIMMMLAAGGNLINDYFDIQEDAINKPRRALVGRVVPRRVVLFAHHTLTGAALVMGLVLSWKFRNPIPFLWILILASLLWGYSPWFKRRFLRGNLVIMCIVGQLPLWCLLGELLEATWNPFPWSRLTVITVLYVGLSGWVTFLREVTKDLQDIEGDKLAGYDTLAVRWGPEHTRKLLMQLFGWCWAPLILTLFLAISQNENAFGTALFIVPFAFAHIQLIRKQVHSTSAWLKMTLAGGVVFLALPLV